jgi:hypothetical protein
MRERGAMATVYRVWTSVVFAAIVVQVALAGYGAFHAVDKSHDAGSIGKKSVEHGFDAHAILGTIIIVAALLLVLFAWLSKGGAARTKWAAFLFVATLVQLGFAAAGHAVAGLGVLHGAWALVVYALAGIIAHRAWSEGRASARTASPAA